MGFGMPSWVCPPKITSMPLTLPAIFLSTSQPLWERTITRSTFFDLASSTIFCMFSSLMPNDQFGINLLGLAMGVYGNACPMTAIDTPLTVFIS